MILATGLLLAVYIIGIVAIALFWRR